MKWLFAFVASAASLPLPQLTRDVIRLEAKYMNIPYVTEYYAGLSVRSATVMDCAEIAPAAMTAPMVLIGDPHTSNDSVLFLRSLMRAKAQAGLKPAVVIEFVFNRHQSVVERYMRREITLADVRKAIGWDQFPWAWKWDDVAMILSDARDLGLRVIAAEEGSNNMKTRDPFAASVIAKDAKAHAGQTYLVMYGTMHLLGAGHLGDHLKRLGFTRSLTVLDFLGHKTEEALQAARANTACVRLSPEIVVRTPKSLLESLEEYHEYLSQIGHQ